MENDHDLPDDFDMRDYRIEELDGQIPFPFAAPKRELAWNENASAHFLKVLGKSMDKAAFNFRASLEKQGTRIFDVLSKNDFKSVETDYGAPAKGLSFFKDLIDPVRSFRYEQVHTVEGVYKTHTLQATQIAKALKRKGYRVFDKLNEDQYPSQIYFTDGGVTRAFGDVVDNVIEEYAKLELTKNLFGHAQTAAILVPVPTYGLFLYKLQEAVAGKPIALVYVRRKDNGSVDQSSLKVAINNCRERNTRILAYYDCNPHNPTGYIRERAETEDIASILAQETNRSLGHDISLLGNIMKAGPEQKSNVDKAKPWVMSLERVQAGIVLIDDMAYEGLEHTNQKKPYSFGQVSDFVADRTAVLKGISKIGLPGLRAGLLIAHSGIVTPLAETQLMREFTASSLGVDILAARFGHKSPYRKAFNNHINSLRREHNYQTGVAEVFFNGLENTDKLTQQEKSRLVKNYAAYTGKDISESKAILSEGLKPFSLGENVECGFFHRINCEALSGHRVYIQFETSKWPQPASLHDNYGLYWAFRSFGMKVVGASQQGLSDQSMQVRITTSLPEKEMFRFHNSMREMRNYFFGDKPEIQLDLLRKNYPLPQIS